MRTITPQGPTNLAMLAGVAAVTVVGCADVGTLQTYELGDPVILVSEESGLLVFPVRVEVDPAGAAYVLDWQQCNVQVFDQDGARISKIGGCGEGPTELGNPYGLVMSDDGVRVIDRGNGRIKEFSIDGQLLDASNLPPSASVARVAVSADGVIAVTMEGRGGHLVDLYSDEAEFIRGLGIPPVDFESWPSEAIKDEAVAGRVPNAFRNDVISAFGSGRDLWLLLVGEGVARLYAAERNLVSEVMVDVPETETIRDHYIEANRSEHDPMIVHPLRYFTDARIVAEDLWILLGMPAGADPTLLIVDGETGIKARIVAVGGGTGGRLAIGFAVDVPRRRLLIIDQTKSEVLVYELPSELRL